MASLSVEAVCCKRFSATLDKISCWQNIMASRFLTSSGKAEARALEAKVEAGKWGSEQLKCHEGAKDFKYGANCRPTRSTTIKRDIPFIYEIIKKKSEEIMKVVKKDDWKSRPINLLFILTNPMSFLCHLANTSVLVVR